MHACSRPCASRGCSGFGGRGDLRRTVHEGDPRAHRRASGAAAASAHLDRGERRRHGAAHRPPRRDLVPQPARSRSRRWHGRSSSTARCAPSTATRAPTRSRMSRETFVAPTREQASPPSARTWRASTGPTRRGVRTRRCRARRTSPLRSRTLAAGRFVVGSPDDVTADLQRFRRPRRHPRVAAFRLARHAARRGGRGNPPRRPRGAAGARYARTDQRVAPAVPRERAVRYGLNVSREATSARRWQYPENHDARRFDSIHDDEWSCGHHQLPGTRHPARPGTLGKSRRDGKPRLRSRRPCRPPPVDSGRKCTRAATGAFVRRAPAIRHSRRFAIRSRGRTRPLSAQGGAHFLMRYSRHVRIVGFMEGLPDLPAKPGVMLGHLTLAADFGAHEHPQQLGRRAVLSPGRPRQTPSSSGRQDER